MLCAVDNNSHEQIAFQDTKLYRYLAYLHPIARTGMVLETTEAEKNSVLGRLAVIASGGVAAVNVAIADKSLVVPAGLAAAGAMVVAFGPTVTNWITGANTPVSANYQSLSQTAPVTMSPGSSALLWVFTEKWQFSAQPVEFSIPVTNLPLMKFAQ
jgi:hypothetical protein